MSSAATAAALCISFHSPVNRLKPSSFSHLPNPKSPAFDAKTHSGLRSSGKVSCTRSSSGSMAEMSSFDAVVGGASGVGGSVVVIEEEPILPNTPLEASANLAQGGAESTLNRMSKWIVAALFGLVIVWRHDAEALWAAMGSVINTWISVVLKQTINHQRPVPQLRNDPGMPSSHAQSIFYAAFFVIYSLIHWLGVNPLTIIVGVLTLGGSSYLTWLRVSQQFHTTSQVIVGAVLGSIIALAWLQSWHMFVLPAFVSSLWVRVVVVLGSACFCAAFLLFVIRHWLRDE